MTCATGVIIASSLNALGSWHDSKVARKIFNRLKNRTPEHYYLATDSAFPQGGQGVQEHIRAPYKQGNRIRADTVAEAQEMMKYNRQLTSCRQAAEWCMRAIQGGFGRLKLPLDIQDSEGRGNTIEIAVRMTNVRTRRIGINQTLQFYVPIWKENEVDALMWDGFEDMVFGEVQKRDRVAMFHTRLVNA